MLLCQRSANVGQFGLGLGLAHQLEHFESLVDLIPGCGPARAARNADEQHQEAEGRQRSHDQRRAEADHDAELEQRDQPAAPLGGSQLRNVHGTEHARGADAQATQKAEEHQRGPVPRQRAAYSRNHIEHRG